MNSRSLWKVKVTAQITRSSRCHVFLIRKATCIQNISKICVKRIINRRSQLLAKNESQVTSDSSRSQAKSQGLPKVVYSWFAKQPVYLNILRKIRITAYPIKNNLVYCRLPLLATSRVNRPLQRNDEKFMIVKTDRQNIKFDLNV